MNRAVLTCAAATAFLLGGHAVPVRGQEKTPKSPSLYQRLGGYDKLAAIFDDVAPRLFAEPQLGRFFTGHATDSDLRQRQRLLELLCQETGGPCAYTGRPLSVAHKGLGMAEADWSVFLKHLGATLDHQGLGAKEKGEVLDLIGRYKADIVEKP
jgi:hemoglobin